MKILIIISILFLSACASSHLKKCSAPQDSSLMHCDLKVQGDYYICEKPKDIYSCQDPQ